MQHLKFWLKVISLLLLWGILLPRLVHAQPGSPDPAFGGGDGFFTTSFLSEGHASASAVAIQSNGRIVVAGGTWIPNGSTPSQLALARYMPDGSLDPTFGQAGKAIFSLADWSISATDMLLLPDGKILCTGNMWNDTQSRWMLARIHTDGTLDNTFDGDGILITQVGNYSQSANALALQPDGKIVVAGNANISGYHEVAVVRYKSSGMLDNTFGGGDGIVTTPVGESYAGASDLVVQPDGKIVISGYAKTNGFEDFLALRYNANGMLDNSFSGDGIIMVSFTAKNDRSTSIALQPDGKLVLAGYAGSIGAPADVEMAVLRLKADGTPDNTFSGGGQATIHVSSWGEFAYDVLVQPDGKILVGGSGRVNANLYHFSLARLNTNGTPDNSFNDDGIVIFPIGPLQSEIYAIALQPDGKVVTVGWELHDSFWHFAIARFLTGLTVDSNAPTVFSGKTTLYPNPVREQATLEYELSSNEEVEINLYDLQGRFIQNLLPSTVRMAGKCSETILFTHELPSGTYFLTIETASGKTALEVIF